MIDEEALFACKKLKWVEVILETEKPTYEEFKTLDSLPTCGTKTKGDTVFVKDEKELYTCLSKKWEKVEEPEEDDSSSSSEKASDNDDDDSDSGSNNNDKPKSSSSDDDEDDDKEPGNNENEKEEEKVPAAKECTADSTNKVTKLDENYFVCTDAKWTKITKDKVLELDLKLRFMCGKDTKVTEAKLCEKETGKCEANEFTNYVCDKNSEDKYEWRKQTAEELETIKLAEELGECNAENANKVTKASNEKIYACIENKWTEQSNVETALKLGKLCTDKNADEIFEYCAKETCTAEETEVYKCANAQWTELTAEELVAFNLTKELGECNENTNSEVIENALAKGYTCYKNTKNVYEWKVTNNNKSYYVKESLCKNISKDETIKALNKLAVLGLASAKRSIDKVNTTDFTNVYTGIIEDEKDKDFIKELDIAGYYLQILNGYGDTIYATDVENYVCGNFTKLTDYRGDTTIYKAVIIGTQTWMAENLNYKVENSYCYYDAKNTDSLANCEKYGRLYTWDAAQTACPEGWHLPDTREWEELQNFVMTDNKLETNTVDTYLKSKTDWKSYSDIPAGIDKYGFNALPVGYRSSYDGFCYQMGLNSYFWSSLGINYDGYGLVHSDVGLRRFSDKKTEARPVRCVQN